MCKVAFIGAGYMSEEHIKAFKDIDGVKLVGIYSKTNSKSINLAKTYSISNVFNSIQELYLNTKPDIVIIAVPELAIIDVLSIVFKYPWACLIEKPVGINLNEAEFILELANKNKINAYVAFNRRHYSSVNLVLNKLDKSDSNRVIYIQDQEDLVAAKLFGQPKKVLENWMFANSVHLIDLFKVFSNGNIINITKLHNMNKENPFIHIVKIDYDNGDIGLYHAIWNSPGPWSVTINTKNERFELKPLEVAYIQESNRKTNQLLISSDNYDVDFKPGIRKQAQLLIDSYKTNYIHTNLPTLKDSFDTMKLVNDIYF